MKKHQRNIAALTLLIAFCACVGYALMNPNHYVENPCPNSTCESSSEFDSDRHERFINNHKSCKDCSKLH